MAGFNLFKRKSDKRDKAAEAASAEADSLARLEISRMDSTNMLAEPVGLTTVRKDLGPAAGESVTGSLMDDILGSLMSTASTTSFMDSPALPDPSPPTLDRKQGGDNGNTYKVYRLGSTPQPEPSAESGTSSAPPANEVSASDIYRFIRGEAENSANASRQELRRAAMSGSRSGAELSSLSANPASVLRPREPNHRNPRLPPTPPLTPSTSRDELRAASAHRADIPLSSSPSTLQPDSLERRSQSSQQIQQLRHTPSPTLSGSDESRGRWRQGRRRTSSGATDSIPNAAQTLNDAGAGVTRSRSTSRSRIGLFFDRKQSLKGRTSGHATPAGSDDERDTSSDDDVPLAVVANVNQMMSPPSDTVMPPAMKRHNTSTISGSKPGASVSRRPSQSSTNSPIVMSRQNTAGMSNGDRKQRLNGGAASQPEKKLRGSNSNPNLAGAAVADNVALGEAGNVESWVRSVNAVNGRATAPQKLRHLRLCRCRKGLLLMEPHLSQSRSFDNVNAGKRSGRPTALAAAAAMAVKNAEDVSTVSSSIPSAASSTLVATDTTASGHGLKMRRSKGNLKQGGTSPSAPPMQSVDGVAAAAAAMGYMMQPQIVAGDAQHQQQQQQLAALSYIAQIAAAAQLQQQIQLQLATFSGAPVSSSAPSSPTSLSPPSSPTVSTINYAGMAPPKLRSRSNTNPNPNLQANTLSPLGMFGPVQPGVLASVGGPNGIPAPAHASSIPAKKKRSEKGKGKVKAPLVPNVEAQAKA
ncbi:hypothetical protein BC829DRAFT_442807 [Chytridium lagenaria]|nr:hypothetical protein BC829DRAFT_442807 [Chytridium lagenaria]